MSKLPIWLLIIFTNFYSVTLFAQINLNIEIHGVDTVLEKNIRQFLSIEQQKDHALLSEGRLSYLYKKAPAEIKKALQPYGYYKPEIKSELSALKPGQWKAIYTIKPGPPIPVADFTLHLSKEIKDDPEFHTILDDITLHKGDTFNHINYENIKTSLAKFAVERGYFNAHFTEHRVEVNLRTYDVRVYLNYDGGIRYRFGKIILNQDVLDPPFLQRYISFKQGEPYNLEALIDLQQALNDSDYFNSVEVSAGKAQRDSNEVPILVKLIPRKRNRYSVGLGYGTDTGARAKLGWEIPRVNKRGHRMNSEVKVSEIGYSVGFQYHVPVLNPRTDQMIYRAGVINEKTVTSESTISTIGASLNNSIGFWRESISLNYQQEEYIVGIDDGLSKLLIPSINLSRTWGRNVIYTLDGFRFDIGLRGANKKIFSDTSFLQLQGGIKAITSIGTHNRVIARGRLGTTWTDDFHQLPSSVRFFAGGAQSVRGYSYQSLGPVDSTGKVIGGRHLMIGSIEFEHSLSHKWAAAVFYDAGNAYDYIDDKLEHGAGFGFRWKSPIGPVRFDFASAISLPGQPWRLHINIGPDL